MSEIAGNIEDVRIRIARAAEKAGRSPEEVTLVAASKGVDVGRIREAINAGVSDFGENRVREAAGKVADLSDLDLKWHLIGHLQRNKVKTALRIFGIIHGVDSTALAEELNRRAAKRVAVLLEVNVAGEASKSGFSPHEVAETVERIALLPNLEVRGLMTVAPMVEDAEKVRPFFRLLRQLAEATGLRELSMGMSGDFEVAVEEGATMVRIGTAIFGRRE